MLDLLLQPLTDRRGQDKKALAKRLGSEIWRLRLDAQPHEAQFYLEYYDAKIDLLDLGRVSPLTHQDVVSIVNYVRENRDQTLQLLQKKLLEPGTLPSWLKVASAESVSEALRFGASLWLFVNAADWEEAESLSHFVARKAMGLANRQPIAQAEPVIRFNAGMLSRIAGMDLVWTSNVMEHLRLDLEDPKAPQLFVFRHASFLGSRSSPGEADVYPDRFLLETAETLALLFPFAETSQKRWHKRIRRKADIDVEAAISCNTPRNLDHYHFWHDRLALIQQTFDNSKPDSMRQWLYDKRDSDKYYTFWFAVLAIVLTLVFGLVQSITGIIQVLRS